MASVATVEVIMSVELDLTDFTGVIDRIFRNPNEPFVRLEGHGINVMLPLHTAAVFAASFRACDDNGKPVAYSQFGSEALSGSTFTFPLETDDNETTHVE